jgi:hypothetical protein
MIYPLDIVRRHSSDVNSVHNLNVVELGHVERLARAKRLSLG